MSRLEQFQEVLQQFRRDWQHPNYRETSFNCPHCGALSLQDWPRLLEEGEDEGMGETFDIVEVSICYACRNAAVWDDRQLVYPIESNAPRPHPEMPESVATIYLEARAVLPHSPRASAALSRLSLEELCKTLEIPGRDLADRVANLVTSKNLSDHTATTLEIVRCYGNDAVHKLDEILTGYKDEDSEDAAMLLEALNEIVEEVIARPRRAKERFDRIPQTKREAIEQRRNKKISQ